MDGRDDSFAFFGQILEQENDLKGSGGIQSRCRFVQENDGRICNEFDTDRGTFPFSSADSLDESVAHLHICTADKSQFIDQVLYDPLFFSFGLIHSQITCELEALSWCESAQKCVFLHHISYLIGVGLNGLDRLTVESKLAFHD